MAGGIQIGGRVVPLEHPETRHPIPCFAWNDPPGSLRVPEFKAGDGYNKGRTSDIDLVVWHWTGGEAEPDRMARTLQRRKLGVEFAISRTGNVFQFCDPIEVDTADAGAVNHRSVGVEIVCYGFAWQRRAPGRVRVPVVPRLGRDRGRYLAYTHGRRVETARFYPAQIATARALADALSGSLPVPRAVPPPSVTGVYAPVLERDAGRFRGHVGHYYVSRWKRDPGPAFMDALRAHFG